MENQVGQHSGVGHLPGPAVPGLALLRTSLLPETCLVDNGFASLLFSSSFQLCFLLLPQDLCLNIFQK